jgi:hypothetical protein
MEFIGVAIIQDRLDADKFEQEKAMKLRHHSPSIVHLICVLMSIHGWLQRLNPRVTMPLRRCHHNRYF